MTSFTQSDIDWALEFHVKIDEVPLQSKRSRLLSIRTERDGALDLASKAFDQRDRYHNRFVIAIGALMLHAVAWLGYLIYKIL